MDELQTALNEIIQTAERWKEVIEDERKKLDLASKALKTIASRESSECEQLHCKNGVHDTGCPVVTARDAVSALLKASVEDTCTFIISDDEVCGEIRLHPIHNTNKSWHRGRPSHLFEDAPKPDPKSFETQKDKALQEIVDAYFNDSRPAHIVMRRMWGIANRALGHNDYD